ncbi:MAG: hypothetical protein WD489_01425 [Rhodovibrionaceae bacterium]
MSARGKDERPETPGQDGGEAAPELEALARRYLDLWQDQMSALAADPEFAQSWRKLLESMGAQAAAWQAQGLPRGGGLPDPMAVMQAMMSGMPQPGTEGGKDGNAGDDGVGNSRAGAKSGAAAAAQRSAPAATASGGGGDDLGRIAARLEQLEQRLAALEAKPSGKGGGARKRTRKPES